MAQIVEPDRSKIGGIGHRRDKVLAGLLGTRAGQEDVVRRSQVRQAV